MYKLTNVEYSYIKNMPALKDISFHVDQGEIVSIIGSNGSGKSTLLHVMSGLIFPQKGKIWFNNEELNEQCLKDDTFNRHFRSQIGYVFQNTEAQLFCPTVFDELMFGPVQLGLDKYEALQRCEQVLEMLNITALKSRPVNMLSGGEKKRVAIGAVLTTNPQVIFFDEPLSGLDPKTRAFVVDLIFELNEVGKTIVIATHHLELVSHLQSRVIVLSENHAILKDGYCDDVLNDTQLLLEANLISEFAHKHNNQIHRHLWINNLRHQHNQ